MTVREKLIVGIFLGFLLGQMAARPSFAIGDGWTDARVAQVIRLLEKIERNTNPTASFLDDTGE